MPDDPLASATKGATEGILNFSSEKIAEFVRKFREGELAFIRDRENIDIVKEQRQSAEYQTLQRFVPKGKLPILVQMGLALRYLVARSYVEVPDTNKVNDLRDKILRRYGTAELHIAELVQIGLVTHLLLHLLKLFPNPADVQHRLTSFLDQVDDLVLFVRKEDEKQVDSKSKLVMSRVDNNAVHMMIIFGRKKANDIVHRIIRKIRASPRGYVIETQEEGPQISVFVFAPELKATLTHWSDALSIQK